MPLSKKRFSYDTLNKVHGYERHDDLSPLLKRRTGSYFLTESGIWSRPPKRYLRDPALYVN